MSPVDLLQNVKQGKPFTFSNYFFLYSMDFTSSVSMWHMSTSVSTMKNFPILFAFRSCTRRLLQFISFILVLYCCLKSFFFLIDKQPNILEKAKKPHVYRGYTEKPKKRAERKKGKNLTHPQVVASHSKKPKRE